MPPPTVSPSPSSVLSSSYAPFSTAQDPTSNRAAPYPDKVLRYAYQSIRGNEESVAAAPLARAQSSVYPPQRQIQESEEQLAVLDSSQTFPEPNQNTPRVATTGGSISSVAHPPSRYNTASLGHTREGQGNPQVGKPFDQGRNAPLNTLAQISDPVYQAPSIQEHGTQLEQIKSQIIALCSTMGIDLYSGPPTQVICPPAFEGQSNPSMIPPQRQARGSNPNRTRRIQRAELDSSQTRIDQFNAQGLTSSQNATMVQGLASASGMELPQNIGLAGFHGSPQHYRQYPHDQVVRSNQASQQNPNLGPAQIGASESKAEPPAPSGQQYPILTQNQSMDNGDLDSIFDSLDSDEMGLLGDIGVFPENSEWNLNTGNQNMDPRYMPRAEGEEGEYGRFPQ